MPNWPAVFSFNSFITAVDGKDDAEPGGVEDSESGVHGLDGESAVVSDRRLGLFR